jgi:hypothetical protein
LELTMPVRRVKPIVREDIVSGKGRNGARD